MKKARKTACTFCPRHCLIIFIHEDDEFKPHSDERPTSNGKSYGSTSESTTMTTAMVTADANDETEVVKQVISGSDDTAVTEAVSEVKLVGEPPLLDEAVEAKGVQDILDALTEEEKSQLADTNMPLRHFRAEKGDTKEAIRKIKDTIQWRKEFGVVKIRDCFEEGGDEEMRHIIEKENETGKIYARGYDKEGRVCLYMRPARENTHDELNNMRHLVYQLERGIACTSHKSGLEKINLLIDYDGFKMRDSPPLSTSRYTLDILQKHYPERMKHAWVCKPPTMFKVFWNIIRPFVDPVTKEKIQFVSAKSGEKKLKATFDMDKMEECAFGTKPLREFDSKEYLSLPFTTTFDE